MQAQHSHASRLWLAVLALLIAAPLSAQDTTMVAIEQEQLFSDAEVAAVVLAANQDEIRQSRLALEQTQNEQIREYAQRMIDEHTALEQEMRQLLQGKQLEPQENPLSIAMTRNLDTKLEDLRAFSASDFDREYMLQQIAAHSMLLNTLESTLAESAQDEELKQLLNDRVRTSVEQHLEQAKQLLRSLDSTGPAVGTPRN